MKKKIRYNRVMIVGVILCVMIVIFIYLMAHRNQICEYSGEIETYVGTYQQDDKIYTFELKGFQLDDVSYLSLNDMYNMIVILDKDAHVYLDQNKHSLTYEMSQNSYCFDYGQHKIVYNNGCIDMKKNDNYIYISSKNIYISVEYIEKSLLNNEKKIKIENKNAIIE